MRFLNKNSKGIAFISWCKIVKFSLVNFSVQNETYTTFTNNQFFKLSDFVSDDFLFRWLTTIPLVFSNLSFLNFRNALLLLLLLGISFVKSLQQLKEECKLLSSSFLDNFLICQNSASQWLTTLRILLINTFIRNCFCKNQFLCNVHVIFAAKCYSCCLKKLTYQLLSLFFFFFRLFSSHCQSQDTNQFIFKLKVFPSFCSCNIVCYFIETFITW